MPISYRLDMGPFYTVINRTAGTLSVVVDGRTFVLKPGRNPGIPSAVVPYAFKQHPRLGTYGEAEDGECLVAVERVSKPEHCRMIESGKEQLGIERFDRDKFPDERGEVQFQRLSTSVGPHEQGPTILNALEKADTVRMLPFDGSEAP